MSTYTCRCSRYQHLPCQNGITQEDLLCDRCRDRVCGRWTTGENQVQGVEGVGGYTVEEMSRLMECIFGSHQPEEEAE